MNFSTTISMNQQCITVQLYAGAAAAVDCRELVICLPVGATIADLRRQLSHEYPNLGPLAAISRWAISRHFVSDEHVIQASQNVAMIPPVSGG